MSDPELTSDIHSPETLRRAAELIQAATPSRPIDLIVGNRIAPVKLPTRSEYKNELKLPDDEELLDRRYWNFLEAIRLVTENTLPNINYLCIAKLLRQGIVRNIISTNYDRFLPSMLTRAPGLGAWQLNPCPPAYEGDPLVWGGDGYLTYNVDATKTSLWKIHGDLGFARMDECGHILRLPHFLVSQFERTLDAQRLLTENRIESLHNVLLSDDPVQDASLLFDHPVRRYVHHTDYGLDKRIFDRERAAAFQTLIDVPKTAILVLGLSLAPRHKEDILVPLLQVAKTGSCPIIFFLPTDYPVQEGDSELIDRLAAETSELIVVNEVWRPKPPKVPHLASSLRLLMEDWLGVTDLDQEYDKWKKDQNWWVPPEVA